MASKILKQCGIYEISIATNSGRKFYIGQSVDMKFRISQHLSKLRHNHHTSPLLQNAFNKYGESAVSVRTILICQRDRSTLLMYEQNVVNFYLASFGRENILNSLIECTSSRLGYKATEETRKRQSASLMGRIMLPESIEKMRQALIGRKLSPEALRKRTEKQIGRPLSAAHKATLSKINLGKKHRPESIEKIKMAKKGFRPSPEHMEMLRRLNTGRKRSPEAIEKTAAKKRGQKLSSEAIAKRHATRLRNSVERGYY